MKKESKAERVVALVNAAIDAMRRAQNAPDSPVNKYTSVEERRDLRRQAKRLRKGQLKPIHENLHDGPTLADILEATAQRDDTFDEARTAFMQANRELEPIILEGDPEVEKALDMLVAQTELEAREGGPGSEAALRLGCLQFLGDAGQKWHDQHRRQNASGMMHIAPRLTRDPLVQARMEAAAAEILTSLPDGEPVWTFPVEKIGDDVVTVGFNESRTLFFVNHDDRKLEAFGPFGVRLWKTALGSGFRGLTLNGGAITGEAQRSPDAEWSGFSVNVGTGEVRWEGAPATRPVSQGVQRSDEIRRAVAGLRRLQAQIHQRSKGKLSDGEVRSAIGEGRS